jgi:hypothetical protein
MLLRLWLLVVLTLAGALAPSRACAHVAETRTGDFFATATNSHQETESQVADSHQGFAVAGYETASGYPQAAESGGLRFTQTTASPWFSAEGKFAGQTISDVAGQLRAGTLTAADVPVTLVGDGLIANTRSSLALMQAGIPQAEWTLLRGSAQMEAEIAARMARNGLGSTGTDVLRITGSGGNASTLIGSGTIPPRF